MTDGNSTTFSLAPNPCDVEINPSGGKLCAALAILLAAGYFVFLMRWYEPAISTMDANSYHVQAKLIATSGKTYVVPENDIQYVGYTWLRVGKERFYSLHPPGFSLMLAPVYRLFGPEAALLENPIMAALCILLIYFVCAAWFGPAAGLFAAALSVTFPFINLHALYGYAHIAVLFLLLCSLHCVNIWRRSGKVFPALIAGLLIGFIPSVRTAEALFIPAVSIFALMEMGFSRKTFKGFALYAIGVIAPIAALALYQHEAFGAFLKNGYSMLPSAPPNLFGLEYFERNWRGFLEKMIVEGGGPVFCVGAPAIVALCFSPTHRRKGFALLLLVVPTTIAYMSYYPELIIQSMRFLIPTFPIYAIGCAWLATTAFKNRSAAIIVSLALLGFSAWRGIPQSINKMDALRQKNKILVDLKTELYKNIPNGSVIISGEAVSQYLDYLGRWNLVCMSNLNRAGQNLDDVFRKRNLDRRFSDELDKWTGGKRRVFWVLGAKNEKAFREKFSKDPALKYVTKVDIGENVWANSAMRQLNAEDVNGAKDKAAAVNLDETKKGMIDRQFVALMSNKAIVVYEWKRSSRENRQAGSLSHF